MIRERPEDRHARRREAADRIALDAFAELERKRVLQFQEDLARVAGPEASRCVFVDLRVFDRDWRPPSAAGAASEAQCHGSRFDFWIELRLVD